MVTEMAPTKSIDDYSVFDLIGVELTPEEQESYILELNDEVWTRFIEQRLPFLLTETQLDELRDQLTETIPFDQILTWLQQLAPNTPELVAEYTRDVKTEAIEKSLLAQLAQCEKILANEISEEHRLQQQERHERLQAAIGYAQQQLWDDVDRVLNSSEPFVIGSEGYAINKIDSVEVDEESK